jgi:predicted acyltransferase
MVNGDAASNEGLLSPAAWNLLMYVGVILVWNAPPREAGGAASRRARIARVAGVVLLVALAILYRGPGEPGLVELRTGWWGILGLIGWAYLVACIAYAVFRKSVAGMVGAVALLYCVYVADAAGAFSRLTWITSWVDVGSMWGSHAALTLSGAVLGAMLAAGSGLTTPERRIRWAVLYGIGLAAAASLLHAAHAVHPMFTISKILATPPWCLWCSAITAWLWAAIYWIVDVRRWSRWASFLESAGQNALFAYVLAPAVVFLIVVATRAFGIPNYYGELGSSFAVGLWRSAAFAVLVTWLAGRLARAGLQLRL